MTPRKIIIPIPNRDFDPSEVALPWQILRAAGHIVEFATPDGGPASADPLMLSGEGLDPWGWIPGLKKIRLIGLLLRADRYARSAYRQMQKDPQFQQPKRYDALRVDDYDALLLPGGHAKRVKAYLENAVLQAFVADFFEARNAAGQAKPVAAICHGVVLAARAKSKTSGKSVLHGRKTTALTWQLERSAWHLTKYFARFWDPDYYRTYRESGSEAPGYWGVEQEIRRALASAADFVDVPADAAHRFRKASGMLRDRIDDARPAWVVRDGNYISARWPGDVHTWARQFVDMLNELKGEAR
ncbi:MAG: type 1 glutamine amidotransferase domain-containing protein [Burkholderiaceae bacterium]|nr:type 1 glutamine amidotransferase domain-containing protein [Burkholderiaceae bacterium]